MRQWRPLGAAMKGPMYSFNMTAIGFICASLLFKALNVIFASIPTLNFKIIYEKCGHFSLQACSFFPSANFRNIFKTEFLEHHISSCVLCIFPVFPWTSGAWCTVTQSRGAATKNGSSCGAVSNTQTLLRNATFSSAPYLVHPTRGFFTGTVYTFSDERASPYCPTNLFFPSASKVVPQKSSTSEAKFSKQSRETIVS